MVTTIFFTSLYLFVTPAVVDAVQFQAAQTAVQNRLRKSSEQLQLAEHLLKEQLAPLLDFRQLQPPNWEHAIPRLAPEELAEQLAEQLAEELPKVVENLAAVSGFGLKNLEIVENSGRILKAVSMQRPKQELITELLSENLAEQLLEVVKNLPGFFCSLLGATLTAITYPKLPEISEAYINCYNYRRKLELLVGIPKSAEEDTEDAADFFEGIIPKAFAEEFEKLKKCKTWLQKTVDVPFRGMRIPYDAYAFCVCGATSFDELLRLFEFMRDMNALALLEKIYLTDPKMAERHSKIFGEFPILFFPLASPGAGQPECLQQQQQHIYNAGQVDLQYWAKRHLQRWAEIGNRLARDGFEIVWKCGRREVQERKYVKIRNGKNGMEWKGMGKVWKKWNEKFGGKEWTGWKVWN